MANYLFQTGAKLRLVELMELIDQPIDDYEHLILSKEQLYYFIIQEVFIDIRIIVTHANFLTPTLDQIKFMLFVRMKHFILNVLICLIILKVDVTKFTLVKLVFNSNVDSSLIMIAIQLILNLLFSDAIPKFILLKSLILSLPLLVLTLRLNVYCKFNFTFLNTFFMHQYVSINFSRMDHKEIRLHLQQFHLYFEM